MSKRIKERSKEDKTEQLLTFAHEYLEALEENSAEVVEAIL